MLVSLTLMNVDLMLLSLKVFFTLYILLVVSQFAGGLASQQSCSVPINNFQMFGKSGPQILVHHILP